VRGRTRRVVRARQQRVVAARSFGRLISGGVWVSAARLLGLLLWLVVTSVLARVLTPREFGGFVLLQAIMPFAAVVGSWGLNRLAVREIPEQLSRGRADRAVGFLSGAVTVVVPGAMLAAALCAVALWLCGPRYFGLPAEQPLFVLVGFAVVMFAWQQFVAESLRGFHDLGWPRS